MRNNIQDELMQNTIKVAKRVAITVLCCIPLLIIFAYLTRRVITSNVAQIICFVLILAVAVLLEELFARAKEKRHKEQQLEDKPDVFR